MADQMQYTEIFTPLEARVARENPAWTPHLDALKQAMGEADFDKYINSLAALRKADNRLLMITRREMYRSILISRFLPVIKRSFAVDSVRIVNQ